MADDAAKFREYIEGLHQVYLRAFYAFHLYNAITALGDPSTVGEKEAEENRAVFKMYDNFFDTVLYSLNCYYLVELMKMFDGNKKSLHLRKLISFAKSNAKRLNAKDIEEGIEEVEKKLEAAKDIIGKIRKYRHDYLAHEKEEQTEISISRKEVIEIFDLIGEILNIFSHMTGSPPMCYDVFESECKRNASDMMRPLRDWSHHRLRLIEEEDFATRK